MGLILPTYEERREIEKERMEIINFIMQIQNTKELHILTVMAKKFYADSIQDIPLPLNEFVEMLDFSMVIRMAELFKGENSKYWANRQIKELLDKAIEEYTKIEKEECDIAS